MKNKRTFGYIEIVFDVAYLCTVLFLGFYITMHTESEVQTLYGIMAFVLVIGDAFHLIPRICSAASKDQKKMEHLLGTGKMITSIGMTIFYMILWFVGVLCYSPGSAGMLTLLAGILAAARIIITLLPQNRWGKTESARWNLYRNLPFILLGLMTGVLFFVYRNFGYQNFKWLWLAVLFSFACYLPVVFWVNKYKALGMLMLPKSCAYIWIITMGLHIQL